MKDQQFWIKQLGLKPHPEGGFYQEVYRSAEKIPVASLDKRFNQDHCFSTSIYFLLPGDSFSAFHRLRSDEIWHFYTGHSLTLYLLFPDGTLAKKQLGPNVEKGERFQIVIPHGVWFGARLNRSDGYALVGCTVSPGFEFADFELASRERLLEQFPQHQEIIESLTRI